MDKKTQLQFIAEKIERAKAEAAELARANRMSEYHEMWIHITWLEARWNTVDEAN